MTYISIIFTIFYFIFAVIAINILHAFQSKVSVVKAAGLIIVFAVVFTQSSIFWTKDNSYDWKVVKPLETGWPVPFHFEPHPMKEVWEPSSTSGSNFGYSVLINAGLWAAVFYFIANFFGRIGIVLKPLSFMLILLGFISLIVVVITLNFIALKISELRNPGINYPVVPPSPTIRPLPSPSPAN